MAGDRMRTAQPGHPADPSAPAAHLPVLFAEVLEGLRVLPDGRYLDGTFGRGGHARGVLERLGPGGRLLLMDKDPEAIAVAEAGFGGDPRVSIRRGSFAGMAQWDEARELDGILLDLGVSSPQLDVAERGFSFGKDGPLDMRMDPDSGESAAEWLARADEREIAEVLWTYGEEKQSRRIARRVQDDPDQRKGEFVLVVQGVGEDADARLAEGRRVHAILARQLPPSTAAKLAAEITGAPRKALYGAGPGE